MQGIGELLRISLNQAATLDSMIILAAEYEAKTITPERFAERVYKLLLDYQEKQREDNHAS